MTVFVKVKSLAKRKPIIELEKIDIPTASTVTELISLLVAHYAQNQNLQTAIDDALTCFEDGIFKIFINDEEATDRINLKENDEITIIRLTMLKGGYGYEIF